MSFIVNETMLAMTADADKLPQTLDQPLAADPAEPAPPSGRATNPAKPPIPAAQFPTLTEGDALNKHTLGSGLS